MGPFPLLIILFWTSFWCAQHIQFPSANCIIPHFLWLTLSLIKSLSSCHQRWYLQSWPPVIWVLLRVSVTVIQRLRHKLSQRSVLILKDSKSEKAMAPHSSTLAWKVPWTEEPGRLQSMESRRVRHDRVTSLSLFTFMHWRRKWQPTPVFLPGESQGRGSLVGCWLWGCTQSDATEVT